MTPTDSENTTAPHAARELGIEASSEQAEERELLYICEECGSPIYQGDQFQPGGDANFCPEHAATLADILAFWDDDVSGPEDHAAWPHEFNSIEDAHEHIADLRERIAANGGDHKPLFAA